MRKKTFRDSRESSIASGWTVEAEPSEEAVAESAEASISDPGLDTDEESVGAPRFSNTTLVLFGVLGGLYLLYAWVWLSWAQYYAESNAAIASASGSVGGVLQQVVFWAAPLAPILWFISVLMLNRGRPVWRLMLWIGVGAIVLVPLPLFSGGA